VSNSLLYDLLSETHSKSKQAEFGQYIALKSTDVHRRQCADIEIMQIQRLDWWLKAASCRQKTSASTTTEYSRQWVSDTWRSAGN